MGSTSEAKIILYTNHGCPWAHRAQIALAELNLPFETVIIDLAVPRTAEYLAINPRGLVPTLSYNGEIITESAVVATFLADAHPSHLVKTSNVEGGALQRARYAWAVATYFDKIQPKFFGIVRGASEEDRVKASEEFVDVIVKEFEPLVKDAAPFFGGAAKLNLVEVLTAPFLIRLLAFPKYEGLAPKELLTSLEAKAPAFFKWANTVSKEKSVTYVFDEKKIAEGNLAKVAQFRSGAK